jgi:hypothetical protein
LGKRILRRKKKEAEKAQELEESHRQVIEFAWLLKLNKTTQSLCNFYPQKWRRNQQNFY